MFVCCNLRPLRTTKTKTLEHAVCLQYLTIVCSISPHSKITVMVGGSEDITEVLSSTYQLSSRQRDKECINK